MAKYLHRTLKALSLILSVTKYEYFVLEQDLIVQPWLALNSDLLASASRVLGLKPCHNQPETF